MRYIRNKSAERFKGSGLQDTLTEKIDLSSKEIHKKDDLEAE